jgi:tripartite-type tricarboxylate transporter receptor subunit TctC
VKIVVPFTPGGSTDITARLVGNRLQEVWGQTVVVENKPGAGGNIAADMVAHSDADGYTIFIVGPGMATNPFLYPSLSYDPVMDFEPVHASDHPAQPDVRAEFLAGQIGPGVYRVLQQ